MHWLVKTNNALGWAYRIQGYRQEAYAYYHKAMDLCEENDLLGDDYGLLLNNITYIMSFKNRTAAISYGKMAVKYWKGTNDLQGLGMAYQVLGAVYYQNGSYISAEEMLNKALHIFSSELGLIEWEGRVLSWRGALYQNMDRLDQAEEDLSKALKIGSKDTKAMTLNRLGRVFMSSKKRNWERAKEYTQKSYDVSLTIPDYVYYLSSLARLITIAAEEKEYKRFDEFRSKLDRALEIVDSKEVDKNAQGVAYFGLGRLALGASEAEDAEKYLAEGIDDIAMFGAYARKGVQERLAYVEGNFPDVKPEILHEVVDNLLDIFSDKADGVGQEIYGIVISVLRQWKRWKGV